jgi:hypothetical protein
MRFLALLLILTISALAQNANASAGAQTGSGPTYGATAAPAQGGMVVPVVLTKSIDSKKAKVGDEVAAKVTADIRSGGQVVLPHDSKMMGKITQATARSKGDGTSQLGMIFDRAVLKNGSTINLTATIQAIAPPPQQQSSDDSGSSDMSSSSGGGPMGGGMSGGTPSRGAEGVSTAGGPGGGAVGSAAGGVTGTANTVGTATGSIPNVAGSGAMLTARSVGVIGIKGLELNTSASADGSSTLTSSGKNVKLDSGSYLLIRITAASPAQPAKNEPSNDKQPK